MNEDMFHRQLEHEFDRIKDDVNELNTFYHLKSGKWNEFNKRNEESPGAISQQLLDIVANYIGLAQERINEIQKSTEKKVVEMLTEILEQPTTDTPPEQTKPEAQWKALPDVIHWSGHDKARFLYKVFPEKEPKQLAKDYWEKLKMNDRQALYGAIKRYTNGQIGEPNKFPIPEGIAAMKLFIESQ